MQRFLKALGAVCLFLALGAVLWPAHASADITNGWVLQSSGTSVNLHGVDFVSATVGYAVGGQRDGGNVVLRTSNGGLTWSPVTANLPGFEASAVDFVDPLNGWVCGTQCGRVIHTTDGGLSWTFAEAAAYNSLYDLVFVDGLEGWAVGAAITHTINGGTSWQQQVNPIAKQLYAADFIDAEHGWIVGDGTVLATTDGGDNWTVQLQDYPRMLVSVCAVDAQHLWAVGESGAILETTDGGQHWNSRYIDGVWAQLNDISFVSAAEGWICGDWGLLLHTTDGGATWAAVSIPTTSSVNALTFVGPNRVWAVGDGGVVLHREIDIAPPITRASAASVRRWQAVTLKFRVNDPLPSCGKAVVKIQIRRGTTVVRTILVGTKGTNVGLTYRYKAKLKRGIYNWRVLATDIAGNKAVKRIPATLTVK